MRARWRPAAKAYWTTACETCALKAQCTPGKHRRISRWEHEAVLETVQDRLDRNPEKMRVRRQTVEHLFGTIKAWMFVNKRTPPPGDINASTVRLQQGERVRVCLGGLCGYVPQRTLDPLDLFHGNDSSHIRRSCTTGRRFMSHV